MVVFTRTNKETAELRWTCGVAVEGRHRGHNL